MNHLHGVSTFEDTIIGVIAEQAFMISSNFSCITRYEDAGINLIKFVKLMIKLYKDLISLLPMFGIANYLT